MKRKVLQIEMEEGRGSQGEGREEREEERRGKEGEEFKGK